MKTTKGNNGGSLDRMVRRLLRPFCKHFCHLDDLQRRPDGNVECPCIKCGKMITGQYRFALHCDWDWIVPPNDKVRHGPTD